MILFFRKNISKYGTECDRPLYQHQILYLTVAGVVVVLVLLVFVVTTMIAVLCRRFEWQVELPIVAGVVAEVGSTSVVVVGLDLWQELQQPVVPAMPVA
jgi:uncharacterized integral membrane protein